MPNILWRRCLYLTICLFSNFSLANESIEPIVESTLKTIERNSSQLQKCVNPSPWGNTPGCRECGTNFASLRYMECNEKNSYLENELNNLGANSTFISNLLNKGVKQNSIIKPFCLRLGMDARFSEKSKSFRFCEAGDSRAQKKRIRPCVSEKYFTLINNSFDLVSRCMKNYGVDSVNNHAQDQMALSVYSLINIESGFHPNAMSGTGSGGIGQFTSSAISEINKNEMTDIKNHLENSSPECQQLKQEFLSGTPPMNSQIKKSCDRIALSKGNPALNMIYTYAYAARAKKEIYRRLFVDSRLKTKFKELNEEEKEKLSMDLAVWSHNSGIGGTMKPVMSAINNFYPKGTDITNSEQFIKHVQQQMQDDPHPANSSEDRRRETSRYFPNIQSTLKNIEESMEDHTCLNK